MSGAIIDSLAFVGRSIQGFSQDPRRLVGVMGRLGVGRTVVCPVRPRGYRYAVENQRVGSLCRRSSGTLVGLGRVDPRQPSAAAEASRCLDELGMVGIFLHPWEDAISVVDPRVDAVVAVCESRGRPLVVAAGYPWVSEAAQIADLALRFPDVPFLLGNGGQINISGLGQQSVWLALERCPNLFITTTGVYRADFLAAVVEELGPSRLLFASQSPEYDAEFELDRVQLGRFDEEARQRVLRHNAISLFGLADVVDAAISADTPIRADS